jgi:3-oxoacyl-[acyl-carrier protein] reductase
MMDLRLKDKVAVITGAGSQIGFGKAIALTLAMEGCDIVAVDLDLAGAKLTAAAVEAMGRKALAVKADVRDRVEVDEMVKTALNKFKVIDILVNNAGVISGIKPFTETTRKDWDLHMGVNLYGQMNVAQAVLPHMISRRYGRIVNFSGGQGVPNLSIYGTTKGGVEAFTRSVAKEVAAFGVIINGVDPGLAKTGIATDHTEEHLERYRQRATLKRLCTPEDVAPVVAFLASDVCSYMVGQFIRIETS